MNREQVRYYRSPDGGPLFQVHPSGLVEVHVEGDTWDGTGYSPADLSSLGVIEADPPQRADTGAERPDWWSPDYEQAALAGVQDGIQARRGHTDVDRLRVAKAFDSAMINAIGIHLGMWAGRGDWAGTTETFRDRHGQEALDELDELIARLTEYRGQIADALTGTDVRDVPIRRRANAPDPEQIGDQLITKAERGAQQHTEP